MKFRHWLGVRRDGVGSQGASAGARAEIVTRPEVEYVEHDGVNKLTGDLYILQRRTRRPIVVAISWRRLANGGRLLAVWGPYLAKKGHRRVASTYGGQDGISSQKR